MNTAQEGDRVKVHCTGKLKGGDSFGSSNATEPLQFKIGGGEMLQAFEEAVIGMSVGERKTISVPPERAFGPKSQELIVNMDRHLFKDGKPETGKRFKLRTEGGRSLEAVVVYADKDAVTLDANHPLAGETLVFDIQLVEID